MPDSKHKKDDSQPGTNRDGPDGSGTRDREQRAGRRQGSQPRDKRTGNKPDSKPDHTFGPTRRVRKRADFLRLQGGRRKSRTPHLLIAYDFPPAADASEGQPGVMRESRLGVTVTKKIDKRAVRRNLLKRRIREIFRRIRWRIPRPVDMVVIALEGSMSLSYEELRREVISGMRRARILEDDQRGSGR